MENIIFAETMDGLAVERVVRDHEYSMTSRHFHDSYELYFLLEGERYYFIDKETYLVKKGMAVLIKRSQIHKTSMAGNSYHDRVLLQMKGNVFDPLLQANGFYSMEELFSRNYGIMMMEGREWEQILLLVGQIRTELEKRQSHYEFMVKMKVTELMILISRHEKTVHYDQEIQKAQTAKHQKVHEVADYLLNHCETDESLEELARHFYISKSYLCRIFKEVTGFTVNEYLNMSRIKKAQNLLLHSDYTITEISEILGFESITYFERVFKKLAASTPLKYRQAAGSPDVC